MRRPSIRLRLTLVYTVMLVVTCAALLGLNYAMLYHSLYADVNAPAESEMRAVTEAAARGEAPPLDGKLLAFQEHLAEVARLRTGTLLTTAGTSAVALAVIAVAGLGVSWLIAGRVLRPLRTLTAATRRVSEDHLHERVALAGPHDELKELADTFDEMVARLEASFAGRRRFVADASHELRTPLAIVRTGAEVLLAKRATTIPQWRLMAERTLTATTRAERLLDGLLALARSDSGALVRAPHDLAVAAATALSETDEEAEAASLTVTTDLRAAPLTGDPVLVDRLVRNLVDNAVRHNHPGGRLQVTTCVIGREAVIVVSNSGETIPSAEVGRLFEPFQRLDASRGPSSRSTGLGLAIVDSIVRAHGGTVAATPLPDGGLTVTVRLPAGPGEQTPRSASGELCETPREHVTRR